MVWSFLYLALRGSLELILRCSRSAQAKEIEILVLRHELAVLGRQHPGPGCSPPTERCSRRSAGCCHGRAGRCCWSSRDAAALAPVPGPPARDLPERPDLHMDFLSEEHGVGHRSGDDGVRIGDRLQVIPSHACATVNLFDMAYGVRGDRVERELRITGRGRVR